MKTRKHHYHGKTVRGLFLALALVLLLTSPWQAADQIYGIPPLAIMIISLLVAGYLSRHYAMMYYVSAIIAILFLMYFQYLTSLYVEQGSYALAVTTQINTVIMVFAAYYSVRTTYAWEDPRALGSDDTDIHIR